MAELMKKKHEIFCREYIIDYNGTQAAIRAGYKESNARDQASKLTANADILARIRELQQEQMKRLELSADLVILELIKTYQRCLETTPVLRWNPKSGRWEPSGQYQFDSKGALKALEMLGKHMGMFGNRYGQDDKPKENNLLEKILMGTGEDMDTDDLPEVQ